MDTLTNEEFLQDPCYTDNESTPKKLSDMGSIYIVLCKHFLCCVCYIYSNVDHFQYFRRKYIYSRVSNHRPAVLISFEIFSIPSFLFNFLNLPCY